MKESAYAATIDQCIIASGIHEPEYFRKVTQHLERNQWLLSMGRGTRNFRGARHVGANLKKLHRA